MAIVRPFSRDQRTTIIYGMLAFVLVIVVLQLWLLTATMNAYLGGDERVIVPRRSGQSCGVRVERRTPALRPAHGARIALREDLHMAAASQLPPGEALTLESLITPTPQGIASRILGKAAGGNMTLFAFDEGQGLTEHSSPYDAFVLVLEGPDANDRWDAGAGHTRDRRADAGGDSARAGCTEPCRMLLVMLKCAIAVWGS